MTEPLWVVIPERTQPHWLEVIDPEGWCKASVKWDGCIHFDKFYNAPYPDGEREYMHICDLDDLIKRLQALKLEAQKHFGDKWPHQ